MTVFKLPEDKSPTNFEEFKVFASSETWFYLVSNNVLYKAEISAQNLLSLEFVSDFSWVVEEIPEAQIEDIKLI